MSGLPVAVKRDLQAMATTNEFRLSLLNQNREEARARLVEKRRLLRYRVRNRLATNEDFQLVNGAAAYEAWVSLETIREFADT
jgi:hypothetical protein